MIENKTIGSRIFDVTNHLLLGFIALLCLYPMIHVISSSFSEPKRLAVHLGVILWPQGFSLEGYKIVLKNPNIWIGYSNTLFYVGVGTVLCLFMTSLGAYVLSRKSFILRKPITIFIVFTMYFHGGLIPNFLLVQKIGLYNSRWAIIIPALIATWNLLILRTAFQSVPESLEESAKLDGANDMVILFKIILPVSKASIAVIALYYAVAEWNAWFNAMIYLRKREYYPLQLFLREILISNSTAGGTGDAGENEIMLFIEDIIRNSTIVVATVPILCAYPFIQKYFVKGVMIGSIKG